MDENLQQLITQQRNVFGDPCAGSTCDVWSLSSCRESFACLRGSMVLDGDTVALITGDLSYKGKLLSFAPILAFSRFRETHHTGPALARWKTGALDHWGLRDTIGLATEDGASNNKAANKIMGQEMVRRRPPPTIHSSPPRAAGHTGGAVLTGGLHTA